MFRVTSRSSGTTISLHCVLCQQRLALAHAWLVFPVDARGDEGLWVHDHCIRGKLARIFPGNRGVLMRGQSALVSMAESLMTDA